MALILNIETATKNCSVSVAKDGRCLALIEESADKFVHAEKLHQFIELVLKEAQISTRQLSAIAVSNGPGSYTGLRIGISAAKGLCYALSIPLISIETNKVLAQAMQNIPQNKLILTVTDARRNEVFAQLFSGDKKALSEIEAVILDEHSYAELATKNIHVVGDAAQKTADIIGLKNVNIHQQFPSAKNMCALADTYFAQQAFADVAYHEPFYLKDFVAGKPKKML